VSGKPILLWLLVIGLLNTVVSLFYYLKIPYYSFIRSTQTLAFANPSPDGKKTLTLPNLLAVVLVLLIVVLFFQPGLLMGWINKINFAF
jgi:NADH-quinone oxidoreductase subunit N